MDYKPLILSDGRKSVVEVRTLPAPIEGWFSSSEETEEQPRRARILKNWIPLRSSVKIRNGYVVACTVPGPCQSLMSFSDGTTDKLLAAANGSIYDCPKSGGGAATQIATGNTNNIWQYVSIADAADNVSLAAVNEIHGLASYDLGGWTALTPTGGASGYTDITSHNARLWMVSGPTAYYADPFASKPASVTPFYLGAYLKKGGRLIAVESWSRDGGSGPDDNLVFVSDQGEIIVFSGIDPATDFRLVGVFRAPRPLSRRCLKKMAIDLVYVSEFGPVPLSKLLPGSASFADIPVNPRDAWVEQVERNRFSFGWDVEQYSRKAWMLLNVPIRPPNEMAQYCMSLDTGAWFEINGWNALCMREHEGDLFMGRQDGTIMHVDESQSDGGEFIKAIYQASWNSFGTPSLKNFTLAQMTIRATVRPEPILKMLVNYEESQVEAIPKFVEKSTGSVWDEADWDQAEWESSPSFYNSWFGIQSIGYVGALSYSVAIKNGEQSLHGYRVAFEEGELL